MYFNDFYRYFDYIILTFIFLNSIVLALYDYKDRDSKTRYNQILNYLSSFFSLMFLCEAIIKIIALGLIGSKNSYLRDLWNVMDLVIAITGTMEVVTEFTSY